MALINYGSDDNPDWRESNPAVAAPDTSNGPVWTRYTPQWGSGEDSGFDLGLTRDPANVQRAEQGGHWSGDGAPVAVGRINSQGNNGTLFKGADGYYFDGKKLGIDDAMAQAWVGGKAEADKQERESKNFGDTFDKFGEIAVPLFIAGVATAGFASALAGTAAAETAGAGLAADGGMFGLPTASSAGGVSVSTVGVGAAEAAGTAAVSNLGDTVAFEAASATVPSNAGKGLIDTAITGAGRSAAINGAVQLATTGKIDPAKLTFSAISGGFGGVLGDIVGEATGMPFAGQVAGAVTGAIVGNALADKTAAGSAAVGAGSTTSDAATGDAAKTIVPANLKFGSSGLIYSKAPRTTDWLTPRLNWSGNA